MQQLQHMIPADEDQSTIMMSPQKGVIALSFMTKPKKMTRCKSDGSAYRTSRASRTAALATASPSSPESVVTYLGRSYSLKDMFPDLDASSIGDLNSGSEDEASCGPDNDKQDQQQQQREERPIKQIVVPARVVRPNSSPISPKRPRRVMRAASASSHGLGRKVPPARSKSSEDLSQMMAAVQKRHRQKQDDSAAKPPGLLRSKTLDAVKSIFGESSDSDINDVDQRFGMYSNSVRSLNYTQVDVANICDDHREFVRLKETLKKQGAITNEVLKQGLHFYVQAKKDRDANQKQPRRRRRHPPGRAHSHDESAAIQRSGTTGSF